MNPIHELPLRRPLPWAVLLGYLQPRLIADAERITDGRYERRHGTDWIAVGARADGRALQIAAPASACRDELRTRVGALFATDEDPQPAAQQLASCPLLTPRIARLPGLRPLGSWDAFELCLRTVVGQQVTVAAAGTLMRRLRERCGELTPQSVLAANLSAMGMPGKRIETLRGLALAVCEQHVSLTADWDEIDESLQRLPGFGPWTRSYLAIRLGRQPDAFPHSDIGLIRAAGVSTPRELLRRAEAWRPYRALAATYLWAASEAASPAPKRSR